MGYDHRFEFFEKDPIPGWEKKEYTELYRTLNALRHNNPALFAGEKGGVAEYVAGVPEAVLAFHRQVEGNAVLSVFNLSTEEQSVIATVAEAGEWTNAMTGEKLTVEAGKEYKLAAWEYYILTK